MNETPPAQTPNPANRQAARCSEMVNPGGQWGAFHMIRCKRKAVVERKGKPYCKAHDPVARNEKLNAALEADRLKWDERKKVEDRNRTCIDACAGIQNPAAIKQLIETANRTLYHWDGYDGKYLYKDCRRELINALAALDSPVPELENQPRK